MFVVLQCYRKANPDYFLFQYLGPVASETLFCDYLRLITNSRYHDQNNTKKKKLKKKNSTFQKKIVLFSSMKAI